MTEQYIGEIRLFGFNFAPVGWALCNGQILPINQNTALFSLLGTTYGGNGTTTFALPNLQGRVAIHQGDGAGLSPYEMGQSGGSEDETLNVNQMPAHNHEVLGHNGPSNSPKPLGRVPASTSTDAYASVPVNPMAAGMIAPTGGGEPFPILQPYLTINFCIAVEGVFPSRS